MKKILNRKYKREPISIVVVHIERSLDNYSAYIDELPGCIATSDNLDNLKREISDAAKSHLELMSEYKDRIPTVFKGKYILKFKQ